MDGVEQQLWMGGCNVKSGERKKELGILTAFEAPHRCPTCVYEQMIIIVITHSNQIFTLHIYSISVYIHGKCAVKHSFRLWKRRAGEERKREKKETVCCQMTCLLYPQTIMSTY